MSAAQHDLRGAASACKVAANYMSNVPIAICRACCCEDVRCLFLQRVNFFQRFGSALACWNMPKRRCLLARVSLTARMLAITTESGAKGIPLQVVVFQPAARAFALLRQAQCVQAWTKARKKVKDLTPG